MSDPNALLTAYITWLEEVRRTSPNTVLAYRRDLTSLFAFLEKHTGGPLTENTFGALTPSDIQAYLASRLTPGGRLNRGSSSAKTSLNRQLSALRGFTKWLHTTHGVGNPAISRLHGLKAPAPVPKALNHEQAWQLLEGLAPPAAGHTSTPEVRRNFALFITLYGLGLRISEALSLTRGDVAGDTLIVTGKGSKQRQLPLPLPVKSALNQWLTASQSSEIGSHPSAPLFPNPQGKALSPRFAQKILQTTREALNLPAHPHPPTPCATASPPTCWKAAPTSAPCRSFSATPNSPPPSGIWPPTSSASSAFTANPTPSPSNRPPSTP